MYKGKLTKYQSYHNCIIIKYKLDEGGISNI